jgi:NAD(P) transhydrogenase subunit beta
VSAGARLREARRVVIVPGYGLAVAQAQHVLAVLAGELRRGGTEVVFALHPVAGRMPGQLNVLLDEAGVAWADVRDLDGATFGPDDVVLAVGADDVLNPALGMPVFPVADAGAVIAVTTPAGGGFAGVPNAVLERATVLRGDARAVLTELLGELLGRG